MEAFGDVQITSCSVPQPGFLLVQVMVSETGVLRVVCCPGSLFVQRGHRQALRHLEGAELTKTWHPRAFADDSFRVIPRRLQQLACGQEQHIPNLFFQGPCISLFRLSRLHLPGPLANGSLIRIWCQC